MPQLKNPVGANTINYKCRVIGKIIDVTHIDLINVCKFERKRAA